MKVFTMRFFGGTFIVALGLLSLFVGFLSLLTPINNLAIGIILVVIGYILVLFGKKFVRDPIPSASKIASDTLRRANLLDKTRKN